jgi:type IV pilus assembly protein PilY1
MIKKESAKMKRKMKHLKRSVLAAVLAAASFGFAGAVQAAAFISNGSIALGVNDQGHLNVPSTAPITPGSGPYPGASRGGVAPVGVRALFPPISGGPIGGGLASTEPGCLCEGWGAAIASTGTSGYANVATDLGANNLTLISFTATPSTATSVVRINNVTGTPVLEVKHHYHPNAFTSHLYQVDVSITNLGPALVAGDLRYRRVMDWDVEPTSFSEFVTIAGVPAALGVVNGNNVNGTSRDGFSSANPLATKNLLLAPTACAPNNANFTDCGPDDHGALFDFEFEALASGATRMFSIFYGAAPSEAAANAARFAVDGNPLTEDISLYSYGQCNPGAFPFEPCGGPAPTAGGPATFIFGFGSAAGVLTPPPGLPEPGTLALAGLALALLAMIRRRRSA